MTKLSDEEIMNMPLEEAEAYTDTHPDESLRFAELYYKSAIKQVVKAIFPRREAK